MDTLRFAIESADVPWKMLRLDGEGETSLQMYLQGKHDGPEAIRAKISEGHEVEPHFHLAAQFQLLLEGSMEFPVFRLDAPAIHYTDHNVPYGPFKVSGHDMLVLHNRPGGVVMMRDKKRRYQANTGGREISRCAHEVEWESMTDYPQARRKVLIPESWGPSAEIVECPPNMVFAGRTPEYGRYEVVLSGSVSAEDKQIGPKGLRFVAAGQNGPALRCGPDGATLIVLTFDQDAAQSYGGSAEDAISEQQK